MKASGLGLLLIFASLPLAGQAPQANSDALGFSYSLPSDWETVVPKPPRAEQQPKPSQNTPEEVKKGITCVEVPLTAQHGDPASAVVIVALPFDCFGQTMAEQDLAEFGSGVTEGLKTALDFLNPITASYTLGDHRFWIERLKAVPKGKAAPASTVEITCTILEKGAVCWMAQAADTAGLRAFEDSEVTLKGSVAERLVPSDVFLQAH